MIKTTHEDARGEVPASLDYARAPRGEAKCSDHRHFPERRPPTCTAHAKGYNHQTLSGSRVRASDEKLESIDRCKKKATQLQIQSIFRGEGCRNRAKKREAILDRPIEREKEIHTERAVYINLLLWATHERYPPSAEEIIRPNTLRGLKFVCRT